MNYSKKQYQDESYEIIGTCMEVHRILGIGFLEIVYKDALEYEFKKKGIVDNHYKWILNYLAASKCKLGLLVNFGEESLVTKRLIL